MKSLVSRRRAIAAAIAIPGLVVAERGLGNSSSMASALQATPEGTPEATGQEQNLGQATAPAWIFAVLDFQDPYVGKVTTPREQQPGTRYVGVEVRITNNSDQPMEFSNVDVLLRDIDGVSYAGGKVTGSEPKLVSQNLPDGERTRGWVWFSVPEDVTIVEVRFVGPSPVFRINL